MPKSINQDQDAHMRTLNYISVAEAAQRVGVNPQTIRRWIAKGYIDAVRVGPRIIRVREIDVELMIRPLTG